MMSEEGLNTLGALLPDDPIDVARLLIGAKDKVLFPSPICGEGKIHPQKYDVEDLREIADYLNVYCTRREGYCGLPFEDTEEE